MIHAIHSEEETSIGKMFNHIYLEKTAFQAIIQERNFLKKSYLNIKLNYFSYNLLRFGDHYADVFKTIKINEKMKSFKLAPLHSDIFFFSIFLLHF